MTGKPLAQVYPDCQAIPECALALRQPPFATWKPTPFQQPTAMVDLELTEHDAFIARAFRAEQLADERGFRYAVMDLWGELIMDAYGKSNKRLLDALRELRIEEENRELQTQGV